MSESLLGRLRAADTVLADNFHTNCLVIRQMLKKYKNIFRYIADYTMLRTFDVMEICENLIGEENLRCLSADDLYVLMMAASLQYVGLGTDLDKVEAGEEVSEDSGEDIRASRYLDFSIQLIRKYGGIFESPEKTHEERTVRILRLLAEENSGLSRENAKDEAGETDLYLSAVLAAADTMAELLNRNQELSAERFYDFTDNEIQSCVEHLSVESIHYAGKEILVPIHGSETVLALFEEKVRKMNAVLKDRGEIVRQKTSFDFPYEVLRLEVHAPEKKEENVFLNREIEKNWTDADHEAFSRFSEEERAYYLNYLTAEYGMTKRIKDFAASHHALLEGLEYRVKSPRSVYSKLHHNTNGRTLETIADTIRYTVVSTADVYTENCLEILHILEKEGWLVMEVENYWLEKKLPYNGVNVNLRNSSGFISEIQFHTPESFRVKMSEEDHTLYEKRRVLRPGTPAYNEILQQQFALYADMPVPKGIEKVIR